MGGQAGRQAGRQTDRQTHKTTTVTLVHACRGLTSKKYDISVVVYAILLADVHIDSGYLVVVTKEGSAMHTLLRASRAVWNARARVFYA